MSLDIKVIIQDEYISDRILSDSIYPDVMFECIDCKKEVECGEYK